MARAIELQRFPEAIVSVPGYGGSYRLRVEVVSATGMPAAVFGHFRRDVNLRDGITAEELAFICSPFELVEYPENEPDPTKAEPFYRKDHFDVILPSRELAEEVWTIVQQEVCHLRETLDRMDRLLIGDTYQCGDADDGASLSQSVSL